MGAGIDLEAASAEPYHLAPGGGRRRRGRCSAACSAIMEDERLFMAVVVTVSLVLTFAPMAIYFLTHREPSRSIHLAGYDGLDPGRAARVVSPSFDVTLLLNHTCVDSVDVAVMYSGVALGWARVEPRDCAEGRWGRDVEVVARGRGVGLSPRLRGRMASDWQDLGALELDVIVKKYREGDDDNIPRVNRDKVKIMDGNNNPLLADIRKVKIKA